MKLYYTDALPSHYVAEIDGEKWLIPVSPISPEAVKQKKPYRGNHELHPVRPEAIAKYYEGSTEPQRDITLRFRVTEEEEQRIKKAAQEAGITLSQYIRSKIL